VKRFPLVLLRFIFFKQQSYVHVVLPAAEQEDFIKNYLIAAFALKLVHTVALVLSQVLASMHILLLILRILWLLLVLLLLLLVLLLLLLPLLLLLVLLQLPLQVSAAVFLLDWERPGSAAAKGPEPPVSVRQPGHQPLNLNLSRCGGPTWLPMSGTSCRP
jgi:hypothetical protein